MKTFRSPRASALATVIILAGIMAVLTASLLKYSASERRLNERQRLILRSRNMSENAAVYASEQITNKLYLLRTFSPQEFTGMNGLTPLPEDVRITPYSVAADVEVVAGLTATSALVYIDPTLPANANNPNAGLQVATSTVPIIAKSTMRHPAVGTVTTYARQDLEVSTMPLYQFAMFYNMDMEFGPGPNMTISGPVHTNGDFIARIQTGFANTLRFTDRVTAAKGFYANTAHRGVTYMADGDSDDGPGGTGPLIFRKPTEAVTAGTDIKNSSGVWRDHKWTSSSTPGSVAETATTQSQFRTFATSTYDGNLRTSLHGVTELVLPAIGNYRDIDDPDTAVDETKNGRQVIEAPAAADAGGVLGTKFSRNAGLYIIVNPDDQERTGMLPNGTSVSMRARSYRAWLNTTNADASHSLSEVVLPGQPSYGALNATVNELPNAYRLNTSVGSNQVLRIPQGGAPDLPGSGYDTPSAVPEFSTTTTTAHDAYFYDLRRGFNNTGYPFDRSSSNLFRPRPIAKIDFDLTRFKMTVERTVLGNTSTTTFSPAIPNNSNWANNVLNASASTTAHGLGLATSDATAFTGFPSLDEIPAIRRTADGTAVPANLNLESFTTNWTTNTSANYTTRYKIEESTAAPTAAGVYTWSTSTTTSTNAVSATYSPSSSSVKAVRVTQYRNGSTTDVLDEQIIPVIGATTTDTVVACLTNDKQIVPTILGAVITPTLATEPAVTEMRIYVDGVEDTPNWTYTVSAISNVTGYLGNNTASSSTGQVGYGNFANRFVATALSSGTGTVTITASKPNTTFASVSRTFTLVKQSLTLFGIQTTHSIIANRGAPPNPFGIYFANSGGATSASDFVTSGASPWFDGITIYIHSVGAEDLTVTGTGNSAVRNRVDSGVRLWNGRGPVVSLPAASYAGRTGFTIGTNDAVYVVGHFNADGTINATLSSTGTGGYSGRYPESTSEMLASIMGDAITILSQPEFTRSGSSPTYRYFQSSGWSDSLSRNRRDDSASYSSSWQSSNPSGSNTLDGINGGIKPALMPNMSVPFFTGSALLGPLPRSTSSSEDPDQRTSKFAPSETEISACLLTGIVPTTRSTSSAKKQTSGGVHNYPRLLENWAGSVALYIRGSMIAMFASQVATEPWGIRYYQGAIRNWGLHESLRDANHDVPLEPIVLGARRMSYRELSASEYATLKATIVALPP